MSARRLVARSFATAASDTAPHDEAARRSVASWLRAADHWHVEYGSLNPDRFDGAALTNHVTHNLVTLALGGAPPARIAEWYDAYVAEKGLESRHVHEAILAAQSPAAAAATFEKAKNVSTEDTGDKPASRGPQRPDTGAALTAITANNWAEHIEVTRASYPAFARYHRDAIARSGVERHLRTHAPALLPGLAGALLHGVIHLGFALEGGDEGMIADGLAYMSSAFQPLGTAGRAPTHAQLFALTEAPMSLVAATLQTLTAAVDGRAFDIARDAQTGPLKDVLITGVQKRFLAFEDGAQMPGSVLDTAGPLQFSATPEEASIVATAVALGTSPRDHPVVRRAFAEAQRMTAALYLGTDNEFVMVHAATSLHSVWNIAQFLETPSDALAALVLWWRAAVAAVICMDFPRLATVTALFKALDSAEGFTAALADASKDEHLALAAETVSKAQSIVEAGEADAEWGRCVELSWGASDEHVPKGVLALYRWASHDANSADASLQTLCLAAAINEVRPHPSGDLGERLWFGV